MGLIGFLFVSFVNVKVRFFKIVISKCHFFAIKIGAKLIKMYGICKFTRAYTRD